MLPTVSRGSQTLHVVADDLATAWITAMKQVFFCGHPVKTEYDKNDAEPSFDVTALVEILHPNDVLHPPKPLPGMKFGVHIADVYAHESVNNSDYVEEILHGIKDDQIGKGPSYPYTYHDRICNYKAFSHEDAKLSHVTLGVKMTLPHSKLQYTQSENASDIVFPAIDQIKYIVEKLKEVPHSRRAQGITWRPYTDTNREDCPCLQRIWARVVEGKLNFQTSWRSRDLFRAFEANAVGMMIIQEDIAKQLGVPMGTYADFSNSLHVYGQPKAVAEVRQMFETLWKRGGLEPEFVAKLNEMSKSDQFDV